MEGAGGSPIPPQPGDRILSSTDGLRIALLATSTEHAGGMTPRRSISEVIVHEAPAHPPRIGRLLDFLIAKGGVVRAEQVRRAGHGRYVVDNARAMGLVLQPRRGWLAASDADVELLAAARAGVVLSCVTQARRLGLWVLDEDQPHLAAPAHSGSARPTRGVLHWAQPLVARDPNVLTDPIVNVLALIATCQPFAAALATWESALRHGLVTKQELERLPFGPRGRELRAVAQPYSDSGLETLVLEGLRILRLPIVAQAYLFGRPVDFLIGDRLVLQVDGAHHVGAQRERDIEFDARLMLMGYHVIRVGYVQVVERWPEVQDVVMRAVAQGLHLVR